jgi:flagellar biosynthesis protein FliP
MAASLALMGIYLGIMVVLQTVSVVLSELSALVAPAASLFVFLALFAVMFVVGWPIAVRIVDRLIPETEEERAAARTVKERTAPRPRELRPRTT